MRLSGITPGDLVLITDTADRKSLALVEVHDGRELIVLPFDGRDIQRVTGRRVIGHYKHRAGELRDVRTIVGRSRQRHGVAVGQAYAEVVADLGPAFTLDGGRATR